MHTNIYTGPRLFVLQAEICTTIGVKVVQISARNTKVYKISKFCKAIFSAFFKFNVQHFATKLCTFTIFDMIFSAVVMDFVFHVLIKI